VSVLQRILCVGAHRDVHELWRDAQPSSTDAADNYVLPRIFVRYECRACGAVSPVRGYFEHHSPEDAWEAGMTKAFLRRDEEARAAAAARHPR